MTEEQLRANAAGADDANNESANIATEMSIGDEGMKMTNVPALEVLSK